MTTRTGPVTEPVAAGSAPVIAVRDLSFSYDGAAVLEDVTVEVRERDFVGVVGPNGGGKTTLLKLVLGLLTPTNGTVRVFGEPPERVRRRIGYVPQTALHDPRFPVTAMDVVLMGRLGSDAALGPLRASARREAAQALERVGLLHLARKPLSALSGGQRQRVLIARALATAPDMLLLDEPTSSLDAGAEREVYALLRDLNSRMTIVLVTHDIAFVSNVVRSVLCVNRRVTYHQTCDLTDVTGELLQRMVGDDRLMVRHDTTCQEGEECSR